MAIKIEDIKATGWDPGRDTTRLVLKATDAALACSIPREEVLERLEALRAEPESFSGDLLFADVAARVAKH
jgi:hypothetical protein